jgi:predicted RNA-binding protein YlqC (UPF0109 family)
MQGMRDFWNRFLNFSFNYLKRVVEYWKGFFTYTLAFIKDDINTVIGLDSKSIAAIKKRKELLKKIEQEKKIQELKLLDKKDKENTN